MTTLRQPYYELSPAVYNALVQAKRHWKIARWIPR